MHRSILVLLALITGWIVYMIAMLMTVYDGFLSMIFQPIIAMICSLLTVGASLVVGFIFKIPLLGKLWKSTPVPAALMLVLSLIILCFGSSLGLSQSFVHPETNQQITGLHSDAALGSYVALIFAITNWPIKPKKSDAQRSAQ